MKILYFAKGQKSETGEDILPVFTEALGKLVEIDYVYGGNEMDEQARAEIFRRYEVVYIGRQSIALPDQLIEDRGLLRFAFSSVGSMRPHVKRAHLEAGLLLTNWGDAPAEVAEGALCLLLASLKGLKHYVVEQTIRDGWKPAPSTPIGGTLNGLKVGVYGCGIIGKRFIELMRPFRSVLRVFDPYLKEVPEGTIRVHSLEELFDQSEAIVIHAGLSDETRHSVNADLLKKLPDHGIIVNTARGLVIDQDALFKELESGRLRAGLDVLRPPEPLLPGDPAKHWENAIFTTHAIEKGWPLDGKIRSFLLRREEVCLENLQRYLAKEPLNSLITPELFDRMT